MKKGEPEKTSCPEEMMLREFFFSQEDVSLAFLYGSLAAGRERPESDADVGVLLEDTSDLARRAVVLCEELELLLPRPVDFVLLNAADPIICMQILSSGTLLCTRKGAYNAFFARTVARYDDLKRVRRPVERALLEHFGVDDHGI